MKQPANKSTAPSIPTDWWDLALPKVTPENAPVEHPAPSPALAHRHSLELLRSVPEATWEMRRSMMNARRFSIP